ncbi:MAG: efflux RND transporter periplasmic adaptor subunit [Deltaproteobacteria bacterium]|nr:efflux RND transporter periplasmic adaptor subunit [Deltaproteobacteria bacterium]
MSDKLSQDLASLRIDREENPEKRGSALRLVAILVVSLAVLGGTYLVVSSYLRAKLFKTEVRVTEVALVSPAQAQVELASTGYVVPQLVSKVGANVAGRIARVAVKEGDTVKAGQVLVELEDIDQRTAIATARSRAAAAKARALAARANMAEAVLQADREHTLVERGVAPPANAADLDARVHSLKQAAGAADAEARAAEAEIQALAVNLKHMTIHAPMDGKVVTKPAEVGELVGPLAGSGPILELADFGTLLVETDVAEARLSMVKVGAPCEIVLDAMPSKRHRGQAVEISPRVNRAKATVMVRVKFLDDMTGVLPDMAARVSFLAMELDAQAMKEPPKLVVPGTAVADRAGTKVVFVLDGDRVRMTPVVLGSSSGYGVELRQGPPAGTRIVNTPPPNLVDGTRVKERTE